MVGHGSIVPRRAYPGRMTSPDTGSTVGARRQPRHAPRQGYLWAFALAAIHAAVTTAVALGSATYGGFLPDSVVGAALQRWLGELVGLLLLLAVLGWTGWWRVTGLHRLTPRRDGWTVLPLLGLVVLGAVVGRFQYGQLLQFRNIAAARPSEIAAYALLVILSGVASILLIYALIPHLLGGGGSRSPVAVVVMTGVVMGLTTVIDDLVFFLGTSLPFSDGLQDAGDILLSMLAQLLLVMPFVAVALRTGAPWLLLPVLLLRLVTVLPAEPWFWAYAALGAAYGLWVAATHRREDAEVPSGL